MIDRNLPLELDDGTPVRLCGPNDQYWHMAQSDERGGRLRVYGRVTGVTRCSKGLTPTWGENYLGYFEKDGIYGGDYSRGIDYMTLRNSGPEEIEEWRK